MVVTTYLYRHFDAEGRLLYVGIATDVKKRSRQHEKASHWAPRIALVTTQAFSTRIKAAIAELQAIDAENPAYNVVPGRERRSKIDQSVMFSARIPKDAVAKIAEECRKRKISKSEFIRDAVEKFLAAP